MNLLKLEGVKMTEWNSATLADVVELVIDYRGKTPKKLGSDWCNDGYRALSAKNIKTGQIVQEDAIRYVDEKLYCKWMKEEIKRGDILITSEAPFGQIYYWDSDEKIVLSQRLFAIRIKKEFDASYVYQYMTTPLFYEEMSARATGTTVIGLRQPELMKCKIKYPNIETQRRISAILCAIDRKRHNNMLINDNLEQQAEALFQHLFIDNVSTDWSEGILSDLGTIVGGSTPSKAKPEYYTAKGIAWITPKDLSINRSKFITHGENDITELGLKNSSASIMPEGTVLFSSRAPIGYIAIAAGKVTTNQGFKSVIPKADVGTAFVYYFLKHNLPIIEGMASGSTFKEVSGSTMKSVPAVIPDRETLRKFSDLCAPIFAQQRTLENQNQSLVALRDSLLSKLMSGEIDVSDIQL